MDISIVIALYNEKESLRELVSGIRETLEAASLSYEIIMVNDGSTDGSWEEIEAIAAETNAGGKEILHGICFRRNYGKSAFTADSRQPREMLSSLWTPTFRTTRKRFRNSTAW